MRAPIRLVGKDIEAAVRPERGAKIVSLRHVASEREWLGEPDADMGPAPSYGDIFTSAARTGWDEMLPTIDPCSDLPDHGEVWALAWDVVDRSDSVLTTEVTGRALPYRFTRRLEIGEARLRASYQVECLAAQPIDVLWAAHPLFLVHGETRVVLPAQVTEMLDVLNAEAVVWPDGADRIDDVQPNSGRKLYLPPDQRIDCAALVDPGGDWLQMRWDTRELRYLGLWFSNGAHEPPPPRIAIEPTNAFYDSRDLAAESGRVQRVVPGMPVNWTVQIALGTGALPR